MDLYNDPFSSILNIPVQIRTDKDEYIFHTIDMVIVDINGHPLALKLSNGGIINWNLVRSIIPK